MRTHSILGALALTALAACGDDAGSGTALGDATDGAASAETQETIDTTPSADTTPAETLETLDTAPVDSATPDTLDTAPVDTTPDTPDTTDTTDTADTTDTTPTDTAPADPTTCAVPSMQELYPGPFPPFPYGPWPLAEGCVAEPHDVVIVLGCPSESDGSPSTCQIERAKIAEQLYEARWSERFIVTGGAVHNEHVEADALHALLVSRGIPDAAILDEPLARHTDENLYYATRIMETEGWTSALVVSEDAGHLMMTALCDANCCVELGRMTLYEWEVLPGLNVKAGHYALIPPGPATADDECALIAAQFMCINQAQREACKDDFKLDTP